MSRRNIEYLLTPRSVAVIGATDRPLSVGATVFQNIRHGGFSGPVWPVNLRSPGVGGERAYKTVAELPEAPDLAVICTPAATVPRLISDLGARGTRAAIVISSGLEAPAEDGRPLGALMLEAACPHLLRILGPNCIGLLSPRIALNASFAHIGARPGHLAFIAQSGALTTAMLDWTQSLQIGFSHFISLGNSADVDFGDLLDFLGDDPHTSAILLYIESITSARKFMSAGRAAARNKPVIVVKSGRAPDGARAATSHTGALAGADDVYDAAFRRAGMLRVSTTRELFDAAEALARLKPLSGERLSIVSNGGGPAVMATDSLVLGGGELARLSETTTHRLNAALPANWSHGNPVDIVGDAPAQRYAAALGAVIENPESDAVLLIHAPTAIVEPSDIARACVTVLRNCETPALTCWMGGNAVQDAKAICGKAGIPAYSTPEEAVGAFLHVAQFHRNQRQLMETPSSVPDEFQASVPIVRTIIESVLADGRDVLMEHEAKQLLAAYGVPVVETHVVSTVAELPDAARAMTFPLVLKILSPDITHKSDVGGVALGIDSIHALEAAGAAMLARCQAAQPHARILGFTLQPLVKRPEAVELIAGIAVDATFGPIILFGQGGTAVEVIADKAISLPPLNLSLARELVSRTRVHRLLAGYRDRSPVDALALHLMLVKISQLVVDFPAILELDVNPLLADHTGVLALDARVRIERTSAKSGQHLAIRPYPKELEETIRIEGREILLRPLRPEDLKQHKAFLARVSADDMRTRFLHAIHELSDRDLAYLTQLDYERAMAFIATIGDNTGVCETLGVVRAHADADNVEAEFAILIRSDFKGKGLGSALLSKLVRYCRDRGIRRIAGEVLAENARMLRLAKQCGFRIEERNEGIVSVVLELTGT